VGFAWGWEVKSERLDTFGLGEDQQVIHTCVLRAWFRQPDGSKGHVIESAPFKFLFIFTGNARPPFQPKPTATQSPTQVLPFNWVIEWDNFVDKGDSTPDHFARKIDTQLTPPLSNMINQITPTEDGLPAALKDILKRLAVRNLLRGYRLRLPTGQAVADAFGLPVLSKDDILAVAASSDQYNAIEAGGFDSRTPLWFYVLAEARHFHGGERLGPVGSTIVAETLIALVRRTEDSILSQPGWQPYLPSDTPGTFELADLLHLAGVFGGDRAPQVPRTYKVRSGDTLSGIAAAQLGDDDRWPQIYVLNRAIIRNPNRIFPGQVFVLPPVNPVGTIPRLYTVRSGDTLSSIAAAKLGSDGRWPEIFALNRDIIVNPDRIFPDMTLILPQH